MRPAACTIVSNNYLAFAIVLAESYRRQHPEAEFFVCVVDDPDPSIRYTGLPFTTVFASELEIPNFTNVAFRYDILELNTAVKPYLLTYLRDHMGIGQAFYFDPDILVLSRLDQLHEELSRHSILLTPHITAPLDNEYSPSERAIRMAGVYNLGFLGIQLDDATAPFLEWWKDRLYRFCVSDIHNGLFVDQSWMDFAPAMVDGVRVLREPQYNVAYWNLAQRRPHSVGKLWMVDGRPVGFFHFSGIDLDDIESLSKHQNRLAMGDRSELRPLFKEYRNLVLDAGYRTYGTLQYSYSSFRELPVQVPPVARQLLQRVDPFGRRWPDPFDVRSEDSFFAWLIEPLAFDKGCLNRLALTVWEGRDDLVREFPDVCGEDLPAFVAWLSGGGAGEAGVDASMLEAVRVELPESESPATSRSSLSFQHHPYEASVAQHSSEFLRTVNLRQPGPLTKWLNEPIPGVANELPHISRLALSIFFERVDVQHGFPDCLDRDQRDFAYWFCHHAVDEYSLHDDLVAGVAQSLLDSFDLARPGDDASWLCHGPVEADASRPRVTRLAVLLYRASPKIRRLFPEAFGADRAAYAEWLLTRGWRELGLHRSLATAIWNPERSWSAGLRAWAQRLLRRPGAKGTASPHYPSPVGSEGPAQVPSAGWARAEQSSVLAPTILPPGINLLGSLDSPTGVGQVARGNSMALRAAGYDVAEISVDQDGFGKSLRGRLQHPGGAPYPVTILHSNADATPRTTGMLPMATATGYTIGFWFWELAFFPSVFAESYSHLDEVWAPSRFCEESFRALATVPVRYVPPCLPKPESMDREQTRARLGLDPERFYFFFSFDVLSVPERKNPLGAIEALRRAVAATSHPLGLVLKVNRMSFGSVELVKRLYEEIADLPVRLITQQTSRTEVEELLNACDACLSLHRSEGLGLLPIESLYLEKPVIATGYGGVTDFLDDSTGYIVPYKLIRLGADYMPYPKEAVWASPDLDAAAELMQRVAEDPVAAGERARRGKQRVEELYGVEAAAARLRAELARIMGPLPRAAAGGTA
jgi:glycosyltransferase involved in cell wall biosynthesis